ncbi:glycosyltransferase [Glutamicibacter ardleyensis]|uniref:glycosyltransferase n=1 Tax=Glutamicibacter ardleyensis TaxID=225894 RepID=UPI003FD29458
MSAPFTLMVSAGTYHLAFNRLGDWIGHWMQNNPQVQVIYQHGPGIPITGADNRVIIPADELMDLFAAADAVVLQGGAGGVMDLRALQRIPLVVPRHPELNEVIDTHQLLFTEKASTLGLVHRANEERQLHDLLDQALAGELKTRCGVSEQTAGISQGIFVLNHLPQKLSLITTLKRMASSIVPIVKSLR